MSLFFEKALLSSTEVGRAGASSHIIHFLIKTEKEISLEEDSLPTPTGKVRSLFNTSPSYTRKPHRESSEAFQFLTKKQPGSLGIKTDLDIQQPLKPWPTFPQIGSKRPSPGADSTFGVSHNRETDQRKGHLVCLRRSFHTKWLSDQVISIIRKSWQGSTESAYPVPGSKGIAGTLFHFQPV